MISVLRRRTSYAAVMRSKPSATLSIRLADAVGTTEKKLRVIEIENWARQVIERVERGSTIEDSRVELKRDWPDGDSNKTARRIAGHCNANTGERVLWLIGVDEKSGVTGASFADLSRWWPMIESQFDEQAPSVRDVVVSAAEGTVVALVFETDRAPFVVRNAAHGQQGGGPVSLEVPWRATTSVRSARRSELLRMLLATSALPSLTLRNAKADLWGRGEEANMEATLTVVVTVYAAIPFGSAVVLPDHQTSGRFSLEKMGIGNDLQVELAAKSLPDSPVMRVRGRIRIEPSNDSPLHTVHQGDQQIVLQGPGFFRFQGSFQLATVRHVWGDPGPLEISFTTRPVGSELSATVDAILLPYTGGREVTGSGVLATWKT